MSRALVHRVLVAAAALAAVAGVSRADGVWTLETVGTGVLGANVSLALDASGAPRMAFNTSGQPRYAWRDAGGWSSEALSTPLGPALAATPAQVQGPALIYFVTPSLALDPVTGEPRIAYSKSPENDVWYAERSPSGWSYQRISTIGEGPSLALDHDGRPHVVFLDHAAGPVYAVRDAQGIWSDEPFGAGAYARSLRLDGSDRPHVALSLMLPNSDLLHAERDANGWSSEPCDTTGNVGFLASLALDASGEPHISYLDQSAQALRYAVRSGATWTVETVASPVGDAGYHALALAPGGEPFIAFHDPANADLRFARREEGVWSSEPVESAGSVGEFCSLALDGEGRPHIGYFDATNARVRYATRSAVVTGVTGGPAPGGSAIARLVPNPLPAGRPLDLVLRLPGPCVVGIELLDPAGRRVASRDAVALAAGLQTLRWDPGVSRAGLYFVRARFGSGEAAVARLVVLR